MSILCTKNYWPRTRLVGVIWKCNMGPVFWYIVYTISRTSQPHEVRQAAAARFVLWDGWRTSTEDEKSGWVGKSIAYNFKLRMTEKSSQMDGWILTRCWSSESKGWTEVQTTTSESHWQSTERNAKPGAGRTQLTRCAVAQAQATKCVRRGGRRPGWAQQRDRWDVPCVLPSLSSW